MIQPYVADDPITSKSVSDNGKNEPETNYSIEILKEKHAKLQDLLHLQRNASTSTAAAADQTATAP